MSFDMDECLDRLCAYLKQPTVIEVADEMYKPIVKEEEMYVQENLDDTGITNSGLTDQY